MTPEEQAEKDAKAFRDLGIVKDAYVLTNEIRDFCEKHGSYLIDERGFEYEEVNDVLNESIDLLFSILKMANDDGAFTGFFEPINDHE